MSRKHIRKIFFVDDEPGIRKAVSRTLSEIDCKVTCFSTAEECLKALMVDDCGLLITDVSMPGMNGVELLEEINKLRPQLPVLIVTGFGDIPMAVRAVKAGAIDFIEKPLDENTFLPVVEKALKLTYGIDGRGDKILTPSELRILTLICDGMSNKKIASILHRSVRTIENHRHRIMKKLNAENTAELVRIAMKMDIQMAETLPKA